MSGQSIPLKPIADQVVVVMGASSGMGRSCALKFAAAGAKVVAAARGAAGLATLQAEIMTNGGQCETLVADVSVLEEVQKVAALAIRAFGRIDTWVGVAGVWITATFEETRPNELSRILDVNLMGQANGAWAALPHLRANVARGEPGGALIFFSSVLSQIGLPLTSAYCASKHGLNGLIDALRIELAQEGVPISVTAVMPYGTNTPIYTTGLSRIGFEPRPAPPIVNPEVVTDLVLHASQHAVARVYGSGFGKASALANQLMPEIMDAAFVEVASAKNQSTDKPVGEDGPNALFEPIADWRVRGDFDDESVSQSPFVDLQLGCTDRDGLDEIRQSLEQTLRPEVAARGVPIEAVRDVILAIARLQATGWGEPAQKETV